MSRLTSDDAAFPTSLLRDSAPTAFPTSLLPDFRSAPTVRGRIRVESGGVSQLSSYCECGYPCVLLRGGALGIGRAPALSGTSRGSSGEARSVGVVSSPHGSSLVAIQAKARGFLLKRSPTKERKPSRKRTSTTTECVYSMLCKVRVHSLNSRKAQRICVSGHFQPVYLTSEEPTCTANTN